MATIKELILEVASGNLSAAEIYEDYFVSWGEQKQDEFLNSLLSAIVQFQRGDSCWDRPAYNRCKDCYGYLEIQRQEELNVRVEAQSSETDSKPQPQTNQQEPTKDDIQLKLFFGEHLDCFLKEVKTCKNGASVARLVKSFIREYKLDKTEQMRYKPLHDALFNKGIISIKNSAWNNAIQR